MTSKTGEPDFFTIMAIVAGIAAVGLFVEWLKEPSPKPAPEAVHHAKAGPRECTGDTCYLALNTFGCRDDDETQRLSHFLFEQDPVAFAQALNQDIAQGKCTQLMKGDTVIREHAGLSYMQVRHRGDPNSYWVDRTDLIDSPPVPATKSAPIK